MLVQNLNSFSRYYLTPADSYLTPAEKKYRNSLRGYYNPFKDVKLNDQRPSTSLPELTKKNLKEHSARLPKYKKQIPVPPTAQPPVPPTVFPHNLRTLRYSKKINYGGHD